MSNAEHLTTAQLAEAHGVTVRTIHRWVGTGRIAPTVKLPGKTGHYLFGPESLPRSMRPADDEVAA